MKHTKLIHVNDVLLIGSDELPSYKTHFNLFKYTISGHIFNRILKMVRSLYNISF